MLKFICGFLPIVSLAYFIAIMAIGVDFAYFDDGGVMKFDKIEKLSNSKNLTANCEKLTYKFDDIYPQEAEDLLHYDENLIIIASGDLADLFNKGKDFTSKFSGFYFVDLETNEITKAEVENMIQASKFKPHGMYLSKETNRIYVINHFGRRKRSYIEIFTVEKVSSSKYPKLSYIGAIDGAFPFVTINDLVESSENELFVTQWRANPLPLKGLKGRISLSEKLTEIRSTLSVSSTYLAQTGFFYCRFDINKLNETQNCLKMNKGFDFGMANGITIDKVSSKEKNTIYVADLYYKKLQVYEIPKSLSFASFKQRNALRNQIKYVKAIDLPDSPDNLHFDESRRVITIGGVPAKYKHLEHDHDPTVRIPGTMVTYDIKTEEVTRKFYHSGEILSAISTCLYPSKETEKKFVCGSPFDTGVLLCSV